MITVDSIRNLWESETKGKQGYAVQEGIVAANRRFNALIGLTDERGNRCLTENGEPTVSKDAPIKLKQVPLIMVSEALGGLFGHNWKQVLDDPSSRVMTMENIGNTAVQPGAFHNVNAWNNAFGGLLEVKVLEAYHAAEWIGDKLFETQNSIQRSERMPGTAMIGDEAQEMTPGQPHPRVQMGERFVDTPVTQKYGLGIDVTRETIFFDPNGNNILKDAEELGKWVRLRKEKRQLQTFMGIVNTYKYNSTSYNTYLTAGNWINKKTGNVLVDWTNVDTALNLFSEMVDQEKGESIAITGPFDILVMPSKLFTARKIIRDTEVQSRTPTTQAVVSSGSNPTNGSFRGDPIDSAIAFQELKKSGVSASDAANYWFVGDFKRAFVYKQNFPLKVRKVPATSYVMEDSDLVLSVFANEMGTPAIVEPRYVVQCTG